MKLLIVSGIIATGLIVSFIAGLLTQTTMPMIVAFCGWTPAIFLVGYGASLAAARYRIVPAGSDYSRTPYPANSNERIPIAERKKRITRYMEENS
jgi:hypothetical protein